MFFVASKLFWLLAAPSHWLAILVLVCALCLLLGRYRTGRWFAVLAALLVFSIGVFPTYVPLVRTLENAYRRPPWPAQVDGILILGAGFDSDVLRARGAPQQNEGAYRLVEAFAAARHYPHAQVVFSGGSGRLEGQAYPEADTARDVLLEMGLDPARLTLEQRSRNTYENLLFSKRLVQPKRGAVWLLVTSAIHMPRAMAIADKLGWPMIAWPSDYITAPSGGGELFDIVANMNHMDYAVHEWIGMWAYRLGGKA